VQKRSQTNGCKPKKEICAYDEAKEKWIRIQAIVLTDERREAVHAGSISIVNINVLSRR
jgi:hypothetical protein